MQDAITEVSGHLPGAAYTNPHPILLRFITSNDYVAVYVLPVELPSGPIDSFLTNARAIILAVSSAANRPPDVTLVRDILGVTLGEARVAALIGSGFRPREAANKLGITEGTARTTLKRVFAKVGVYQRQSELAALLSRLTLG